MKNQLEIANGKKPYTKPMFEVINLEGESIICGSDPMSVSTNPFEGVAEQEW